MHSYLRTAVKFAGFQACTLQWLYMHQVQSASGESLYGLCRRLCQNVYQRL